MPAAYACGRTQIVASEGDLRSEHPLYPGTGEAWNAVVNESVETHSVALRPNDEAELDQVAFGEIPVVTVRQWK